MTPHPYQQQILDDLREGWGEFRRQLVVSPTGSGKTLIFSWLSKEFVDACGKVLILVDQNELVDQAVDKLHRATGITAEREKAEWHASKDAPVVVATVQSMARRLDEWGRDHFELVIADEADKSITDQWAGVLNHFSARVCGFTATPHRTDQRNLGCYYERLIERENLQSLVSKGFLSPVHVEMLPLKIDLSGASITQGDFDVHDLDSIIGPHLLAAAEAIRDMATFRKTLVFLPLVKTAEKFAEIARSIGLQAESVHGKSEDRSQILARFRDNEFEVLANSALLTRGYDDPSIDCILNLRCTKSITLFWQIVGRGTRIAPCKHDLLLLDPHYQSPKHMVCRPAHLIAKNDLQAQAITETIESRARGGGESEQDLISVVCDETQKREAALRKKLEEHKNKKRKTVSAEEFAAAHHNLDLADYEPVMPWESAAVSDRQATYLKQAKIDLTTVRGRGHASKLLDIFFSERKPRLASPKAVALMRRMSHICHSIGIHDLSEVTAAQAGRFFSALKERKQNPQLV